MPLTPLPRRGRRSPARWVFFSAVLHGVFLLALFMAADWRPEVLSAQGGGGMMVRLATLGGISSGEGSSPSRAASAPKETSPSKPSVTQKASEAVHAVDEPKTRESVPRVKKRSRKARRASEENAVEKRKVAAQKLDRQPATPNDATPAHAADVSGRGASGPGVQPGGQDVPGGGEGATSGSARGENPQARVVPWNAQGGPRFRHQAPLRYPLAAQRRNLEGKAVIEAYLDVEGRLLRARVLQADHEVFAKAALACIQGSTFRPARQEGRAIPCLVRIPMRFVLKNF